MRWVVITDGGSVTRRLAWGSGGEETRLRSSNFNGNAVPHTEI
jgi:hypothetical protein